MKIPIKDIITFHTLRTECHINALNYFANLMGYHFPEHDADKNQEPYRTGYAYYNYARHHHNCTLLPQQIDAFNFAHDEHHVMRPHHVEHYQSVMEIQRPHLIEMLCDWHSANFEENVIAKQCEYASVAEFFQIKMSKLDWTPEQLQLIDECIDLISRRANYKIVRDIWDALN